MSGELQIVFIYDTLSVRKEEDDPRDAILYFHPDCIPEERRIAICGQLMGITHFLVDTFSAPKILTLDNGKFAMRKFGRQYILALGCSSVTPDWLLEKQADILYNLTIFFHRDIKSILQSVNGDRLVLSSRLSLIMDHYIPISQHHGDLFALTFGILPILNLPKSASNISLSAAVVLQTCLMKQGVLGGIVMYQNKVLSVELMQELAQKLSFIQPYQLPPAEPAKLQFACPPGVQLFTVYLREDEFENLRKHCTTYQNPHRCEPKIMTTKEANHKGKIDPISEEDPSDVSSSLGFSEPSSKELSEDIAELENTSSSTDSSLNKSEPASEKVTHPKLDKFLKASKGQTASQGFHTDSSESKPVPTTKKVFNKGNQLVAVPPPCVHMNGCGPNALKSSRVFKSLENLSVSDDSTTDKPSPPPPGSCFCASLTDPYFPFIRCDGKSISKALLDVYANAGVDESKQNEDDKENETEIEPVPPQETNNEDILEQTPKSLPSLSLPNGSLSLHVDSSSEKKQICTQEPANSDVVDSVNTPAPRRPADLPLNSKKYSRKKSKRRWSTFEDMMSPVVDTPSRVSESFPAVLPNINENWKNSTAAEVMDGSIPSHQELFSSFRKLSSHDELLNNSSQTIPTDYPPDNTMKPNGSMMKNIVSNSRTPSMTGKISLHSREMSAIDFGSISQQNMSGSSSSSSNKDPAQLLGHENSSHHSKLTTNSNNMNYRNHVKSSLFIYGLGSMRLLLLLEKDRGSNHELIKSLSCSLNWLLLLDFSQWECGSSSLSELETAISNVEEQTMSTTASQHDHYCYLHYESVWRSLAHGGRNHSMDFDVVQQMHQDFNVYPNISELIIRGEDHVVYGYQCVGSEVFYQQSAGLQPGLPMPSDLMGKVPLKAKKRLERDHNILLL
ncbi:Hermansky-Pudlak syndrome 4 protein [Orchesella cincta]|uniref:Hermansky-Pudlak syndrome 4 protein n=1 Tax=Orchesella cincta TaxID=48709 RepID=A0A1D2MD53_ORCCI|nr:Hermansky-Pudlak syndrome 4 protein [Orchesella cincta]